MFFCYILLNNKMYFFLILYYIYLFFLERFSLLTVGDFKTPCAEFAESSFFFPVSLVFSQQKDFVGLSFPTISSVGPNGAIIHYRSARK